MIKIQSLVRIQDNRGNLTFFEDQRLAVSNFSIVNSLKSKELKLASFDVAFFIVLSGSSDVIVNSEFTDSFTLNLRTSQHVITIEKPKSVKCFNFSTNFVALIAWK